MSKNNLAISWYSDQSTGNIPAEYMPTSLNEAKAVGYDGVTFSVAFHVDLNSGQLLTGFSYDSMYRWVDYAKSIGLDVGIKSHITQGDQNNNINLWTTLGDNFSHTTMFSGLKDQMVKVAAEAQQRGVETFYVGTENNGFTGVDFRSEWDSLITSIREVFSGKITYDALYLDWSKDWGGDMGFHRTDDYTNVSFFDLLDAVSLSFYPRLSFEPIENLEEVVNKFFYRPDITNYSVVNDVIDLFEKYQKPIYLGETAFNHTLRALETYVSEAELLEQQLEPTTEQALLGWKALYEVINNNLNGIVDNVELYSLSPWLYQDWVSNGPSGSPAEYYRQWRQIESNPLNPEITQALSPYFNSNSYHEISKYTGSEYNDKIIVNSGFNFIHPLGGDNEITGGTGIDTVVYDSNVSSILTISDGYRVNGDSLTNIERLQFSDANIALDTDGATSAGGIYRLYKATFNRDPDHGGLGYWIAQADAGNKSAVQMAEDFTWSTEFQELYDITTSDNYGTGSDVSDLVTGFYQNVLGRAPDQGGLNYYTGVIESHEKTVGRVLAEISDSPENYDNTIELIQNGIQYDLWVG